MKVGVIGTGFMGTNHVRILSDMKDVEKVFVYDVDTSRARALATHNAPVYLCDTIDALIEQSDAVTICTPNSTHGSFARMAWGKGVHTLIEKPLASTFAEADILVRAAPANLVTGVGQIERFNPIVAEMEKLLSKPLYLSLKRHNPSSVRHVGMTKVVEDLMIHDIDIAFNVFFKDWARRGLVNCGEVCSDDIALGRYLVYGETFVDISASRKAQKKIRSIYAECEDYTVEGDYVTQEVYIHHKPQRYTISDGRYVQENLVEKVVVKRVEPLYTELKTFIQCVQDKQPFPVTLQQGADNVAIAEAIQEKHYARLR